MINEAMGCIQSIDYDLNFYMLLGKLVQTEDILRSMRPFSLENEMDQDVKEKLLAHLKPLVNVIYAKG